MSEIEVSIIVVSDWIHPTRKRSWKHELECLQGIAGLDFDLPIEVILVDDIAYRDEIPFSEATRLVPGLIIELVDHRESSRLKDRAVQLARGRYVAMFEADCVPEPDWLGRLYELLSNAPDVAGVSGKTVYAIDNSMDRVLTLLDRGFNDEGRIARTPHLSNNASLCRREFLLRYPYPDHPNPFVSGRQRIAMMSRGGNVFMIDPKPSASTTVKGGRSSAMCVATPVFPTTWMPMPVGCNRYAVSCWIG
jgi:hypothetical protein